MKAGLQFESILKRGLLEYAFGLPDNSPEFRYTYHEVIEEAQHSLMFQEFVNRCGLPVPGLRWDLKFGARRVIWMARRFPSMFFVFVLAGEDPIDHVQRTALRSGRELHPLLERIMRIHVTEEARHLSFARQYLRTNAPSLTWWQRQRIATMAPIILATMAGGHDAAARSPRAHLRHPEARHRRGVRARIDRARTDTSLAAQGAVPARGARPRDLVQPPAVEGVRHLGAPGRRHAGRAEHSPSGIDGRVRRRFGPISEAAACAPSCGASCVRMRVTVIAVVHRVRRPDRSCFTTMLRSDDAAAERELRPEARGSPAGCARSTAGPGRCGSCRSSARSRRVWSRSSENPPGYSLPAPISWCVTSGASGLIVRLLRCVCPAWCRNMPGHRA